MLTSSFSEQQTQKQTNNIILTYLSVRFFRGEQHVQNVLCLYFLISVLHFIQQLRSANKKCIFQLFYFR